MKKVFLIISLILLVYSIGFAQDQKELDSLTQILTTAKHDTTKLKMYLKIGDLYEYSMPDSALIYLNKLLDVADSNRDKEIIALCYNHLGIVYQNFGKYQLAIDYYTKAKKINKETDNKVGLGGNFVNIGLIYYYQGNYDKALEFYHKSLKISDKMGDARLKSVSLSNIGLVYFEQSEYKKAIDYYQQSLKIDLESNNINGTANTYLSLGNVYGEKGNLDTALYYFEKALVVNKELGNQYDIGFCQGNIGVVLEERNQLDEALEKYKSTVKIYKSIGYKYGEAIYLNHISNAFILKKEYKSAFFYAEEALSIAKEVGALEIEKASYKLLSVVYQEQKNYKMALKYREKWVELNDSIFNKEKAKSIAEMNTKYETEKKEKQIIQQQAELKTSKLEAEKEKAEKQRQQSQRNMFIIAFGLMIVLAAFVFRSYKQKKKANILLAEQKEQIANANEELNQQNEEITAQRDKIETQRDLVLSQKEKIEEIHHEISQSIDYATRLQGAILPEEEILNKYLSEHFVLYKPKDKVSGDFYWWSHIENHTIITAADSTGHGVPGAFMSMLGGSLLREIVQKEYVTHTGVILRKLRKEIIKALKQKGEMGEQKDGMDMAIISIDHKTNIVQFSGANNPLYILTNRPLDNLKPVNDLEYFYEIKPDKMPIAIYEKMNNFTAHEIQLEKGDQLYMFSDGFADQFGGPNLALRQAGGKKFKYKPFRRLISENRDKPMKEQKEILNATFETWKAELEQIDDVVVLGVKLGEKILDI